MRVGCWLSVIEKTEKEKEEARGDGLYSAKLVKRKGGGDGLGEREEKGEEFTRNEN
jgi:hypothetical protein